VLAHYGINPDQIDPTSHILTSRTDIAGLERQTSTVDSQASVCADQPVVCMPI